MTKAKSVRLEASAEGGIRMFIFLAWLFLSHMLEPAKRWLRAPPWAFY